MGHYQRTEVNSDKTLVYIYTGITASDLSTWVNDMLIANGYKAQTPTSGVGLEYIRGSRIMRLLLGALSKYFKYLVSVDALDANTVQLSLISKTSGMSGGLIGVSQVRTELQRLGNILRTL